MSHRNSIPTIGVLPGWQFYRTATRFGYLKPVFNGISRAALDLHCSLLFGCGMGASASPADPIRPAWPELMPDTDYVPIGPADTDGLIVFNPLHSPARSQYLQDLRNTGYPVVFIGSGETGPTIVADNASGIFEAIEHLVEHGHQRIAFIAGSPDDMKGDSGDRLNAYQTAMASFGLDYDSRIVAHGQHIYNGGLAAMRQILASGVTFSAVFASNDESAYGAMQALKEAGQRIPQDVAVIGFDNRLESITHDPPLSSVYIPLFELGYRAVESMLKHLESETEGDETIKVNTRLIRRESCGCGRWTMISDRSNVENETRLRNSPVQRSELIQTIANTTLNQAQNIAEDECRSLSSQLVESFSASIDKNDGSAFLSVLEHVLDRTITAEDEANIWQDALSLLKASFRKLPLTTQDQSNLVGDILDQARLIISIHMQHQHRRYLIEQRWSNSRLSLLTASLQTALDESHIYDILAQHLPNMEIPLALIVLFEAEEGNPIAGSVLRNALKPEEEPIHFVSREFPAAKLFSNDQAFQLALIPLVNQNSQLGYLAFGTDHFDLYGSIVQQLAAAFNTAQLYKQATEGRRLAEEADRMKSRFLSTISHELRTPISLVVGLSAMMLRASDEGDTPLPDATQKDIERIHTYSQHLGGLIGDVIDLATSQAGQLHLNNAYVDLGQALRMVVESGRQLAADKGLVWNAELPESGSWVWGDQTRLRQVTLNLINNAIKFTSKGGVRLHLELGADSVTVDVQDTGLGISLEDQQVIFDEFRQSDRTIARGYGGLGLGLAISKRLVEMHGGTIAVRSSGEDGAGSTFSFTLPTVPAPVEQVRSADKLSSSEQAVLVLTNRPDTSERLCEHLSRRGFQTQITLIKRGETWRAQLAESRPDTIILDLSTDPALGWETLKEIKGNQGLAGIPVLFFSSSQAEGTLLELDYITKPIEISELTRALDQHWLMAGSIRSTRTILVVDDEPNTLEMHARIVQTHSASNRLLKARNGREALEILRRETVDLILLDLQMPEMDGFEVLDAMRGMESTREIPVIVVTGKVLTQAEMARLNQGVAAVLGKGLFSIDETIAHIGAALEHKRRLSLEAQRLVRSAMAFIHENFAESISRRQIAQHVGITEDHLTFCFRQELGTTPIEYLHRYRINQAKRLLKESRQTITEIALSVGFSDSGYFSRIFRRETGQSPEMFRRS